MVALLHPETSTAGTKADTRPHLRVIEGGAMPASRPLNSLAMVGGAVLVMLFVVFRLVQGAPPASSWEGLADVAYQAEPATASIPAERGPVLVDAERTRIVVEGDTLWAIALELAPDANPQVVVGLLAARNGGTDLQVGQRLVIPAELS